MTPEQIADTLHEYVTWVREQPFGVPTDVDTYMRHLEREAALAVMNERDQVGQGQIESA